MCQKIILSILSFAHALQTPNRWTGNTFGFSSASIPSETDLQGVSSMPRPHLYTSYQKAILVTALGS